MRVVPVQKHFLWTMDAPDSSYSSFEIHIDWKVEREARMEPPIQTEYFLSGGAMILIFMVLGARAVISFCMRSAMPGYMVDPPDRTTLAYKSFLMSTYSRPKNWGWKRASGHLNLSLPTVMTCPSGS